MLSLRVTEMSFGYTDKSTKGSCAKGSCALVLC